MAERTVMTMYVEGGRYFETMVPLGTYEMRNHYARQLC
jgi:hypothetical protein